MFFFSASTPPILLLLLPLSLFLSSNLLMTHSFTFFFPHPVSSVKSINLKIVSLPCTPGAVITPFPSIMINLTVLFGTRQRSHFSRTSPWSKLQAWWFQWRTTSGYSVSIDKLVNEFSRTCFNHLRPLRHIRPAITVCYANMIACSVLGSWLDYANAVLYGTSSKNINRLQRIQNALAQSVLDLKAHRSSNALLHPLRRPFLILSLRTSDQLTTSLRFAAF